MEKERMMAHARLLQEKEKHKIELGAAVDKCTSNLEHERRDMQRKLESLASQHKLEVEREANSFEEKIKEIKEKAQR